MDARLADPRDADELAQLLDEFNREFDTPTPGPEALAGRLRRLLAGRDTFAMLVDTPAAGCAIVTLRMNVWFDGPIALLDELYVVPDRRNLGLGAALLAGVEAEVRRRGGEVVEINVDGEDTDARRFYERHRYSTDRAVNQDEPSVMYFRDLA